MHIEQLREFQKDANIRPGKTAEFSDLGTLASEAEGLLTFCNDRRYVEIALQKENVAAAFVRTQDIREDETDITLIFSATPSVDFFLFHNHLVDNTDFYGARNPSRIADSAEIHPGAYVAPNNVVLGEGVVVAPNAVILENTLIDSDVYIGPGTVIGTDSAQTIQYGGKRHYRIKHGGGVSIGRHTSVGANNVINRSLFKVYTTIGEGVIISHLVNIAHNTRIGDDAIVLANTVVCGSTTIEKGVRVSPGSVIGSGRSIGENALITMGSVVTLDVEPGGHVSGNFAIDHEKFLQHIKRIARQGE
jgi:UDP-3-O-[3-hydroxymyristoyl] glucosamine N-acyltransferase